MSRSETQKHLLWQLDQQQYRAMENWVNKHEEIAYQKSKRRHLKIFDWLILEDQCQHTTRKLVHNYSSREIDKIEEVLAFGLNFALTPSTIPTKEIIARTEAPSRTMNGNRA